MPANLVLAHLGHTGTVAFSFRGSGVPKWLVRDPYRLRRVRCHNPRHVCRIHAGISLGMRQMEAHGWRADLCLVKPDETALITLERN